MLQAHHTRPATTKNLLRWIYTGWFQLMEVFDDVRTGMTGMTLMTLQIRFVRCVVRCVHVIRAVQSKLLHKGLEALGVLADDFQQLWHWQRLQGPPCRCTAECFKPQIMKRFLYLYLYIPLHTFTKPKPQVLLHRSSVFCFGKPIYPPLSLALLEPARSHSANLLSP